MKRRILVVGVLCMLLLWFLTGCGAIFAYSLVNEPVPEEEMNDALKVTLKAIKETCWGWVKPPQVPNKNNCPIEEYWDEWGVELVRKSF